MYVHITKEKKEGEEEKTNIFGRILGKWYIGNDYLTCSSDVYWEKNEIEKV